MRLPGRLPGGVAGRTARLLSVASIAGLLAVIVAPATALANDAHLTIVKTFDRPTVVSGATVGFTITVQIHTDASQDPLCVVLTSTTVQCPAHHVVVTDRLPASPSGLDWTIDGANSAPGCDIGVTTPGFLTCSFGDMIAQNESRTVHVTSTTIPGTAGTCGSVVNPVAHVSYTWEDGTDQSADATNAHAMIACRAATAMPILTLPPTDATTPGSSGAGGHGLVLAVILLLGIAGGSVAVLVRWPARR